jgi:Flp pilus assembly protein TadG
MRWNEIAQELNMPRIHCHGAPGLPGVIVTILRGLLPRGRNDRSLGASKRAESGQSMVEFALILPIILIVMLGVANLGLAIRGQLQLAQVSQEAAQYLVHHPSWAEPDTPLTNPPTYSKLVNYMNTLSSYQLTPLEVHLTVGSSTVLTSTVQQDTVTINYPFPLIFPMVGKLSVGTLHGGTVKLGATASTIAETHPPSASTFSPNPCVMVDTYKNNGNVKNANTNNCPDLPDSQQVGSVELMWQPPTEASFVPLHYCIERVTPSEDDLYYSDSNSGFPSLNNLGCVAAKQSTYTSTGASSPDLYFIDDNNDNNHMGYTGTPPLYSVRAIQQNGLTSEALSVNS